MCHRCMHMFMRGMLLMILMSEDEQLIFLYVTKFSLCTENFVAVLDKLTISLLNQFFSTLHQILKMQLYF